MTTLSYFKYVKLMVVDIPVRNMARTQCCSEDSIHQPTLGGYCRGPVPIPPGGSPWPFVDRDTVARYLALLIQLRASSYALLRFTATI